MNILSDDIRKVYWESEFKWRLIVLISNTMLSVFRQCRPLFFRTQSVMQYVSQFLILPSCQSVVVCFCRLLVEYMCLCIRSHCGALILFVCDHLFLVILCECILFISISVPFHT